MKALTNKIVKNKMIEVGKIAAREEYAEDAKIHANNVARSVIALIMLLMNDKWKCSEKTCQKRFKEICDCLSAKELFGEEITQDDYIECCFETLGIDVTKVNLDIHHIDFV